MEIKCEMNKQQILEAIIKAEGEAYAKLILRGDVYGEGSDYTALARSEWISLYRLCIKFGLNPYFERGF